MLATARNRDRSARGVHRWAVYRGLAGALMVVCLACYGEAPTLPDAALGRVVIQLGGLSNPFGMNVGVSTDLWAEVVDTMGAK